jgi:indole-3-glycerol phosphate synthase/phosphoribosylanthranilate isomerase
LIMNILEKIIASKKIEIAQLYVEYGHLEMSSEPIPDTPLFYQRLAAARTQQTPFFITEFKRKSPSEGWIQAGAVVPPQIEAYARMGAGAISVLTDEPFFGGTYADLAAARQCLDQMEYPPLLLQKDFILDPLQLRLARYFGADIILLIAAILDAETLDFLRKTAESLGLGVLVEVHDEEELKKIQHLDFQVLGVNNRDLKTFRTALNRVNFLRQKITQPRYLIAESGVLDYRHFQVVRASDGFLIGTGLMREAHLKGDFARHFRADGPFLFKACGIRTAALWQHLLATPVGDWVGINFSPRSRRQPDEATLALLQTAPNDAAVAVFYQNSEADIQAILAQYPFKTVQLYAGDVTPSFVRSLRQRVILAVRVEDSQSLMALVAPYAADVDFFILDGAMPGSGQRIATEIPPDFPYPFLLAGGLHADNLALVRVHPNCIGVDIASGLETDGVVDIQQLERIAAHLKQIDSGR